MDMNISRRNLDDEFVPRKLQGTQILGSIASAAVGHILGGGNKSRGSTTTQQTFANPFTSGGGLFGVNFGPGVVPGTLGAVAPADPATGLPIKQAPIRPVINPDGGLRAGNFRRNTRHSNPIFSDEVRGGFGLNAAPPSRLPQPSRGGSGDRMGLDMAITDPRLKDVSDLGLQGAGLFLGNAINNPLADESSLIASRFLNELNETDPMAIAQNQFNLLNPILQEQQMQEQMDLENRLFAQGRLGSTSGSQDFNAFLDSTRDAERKLLFDSLGQGMAVQAQNASLAATLAQLDPTLRQAQLGLAGGMLNLPLGIQQAMLQQAQVAGGLAGATNTGQLTSPGIDVGQSIGAGLLNQGIQGITNAIPGLFSGGGGSFDPSLSDAGFGGGSIFSTPGGAR